MICSMKSGRWNVTHFRRKRTQKSKLKCRTLNLQSTQITTYVDKKKRLKRIYSTWISQTLLQHLEKCPRSIIPKEMFLLEYLH